MTMKNPDVFIPCVTVSRFNLGDAWSARCHNGRKVYIAAMPEKAMAMALREMREIEREMRSTGAAEMTLWEKTEDIISRLGGIAYPLKQSKEMTGIILDLRKLKHELMEKES